MRNISWIQAVWIRTLDAILLPLLIRTPRDFGATPPLPRTVAPGGHPPWAWGDGISLRGLGQILEQPCRMGRADPSAHCLPSPGDLEASGAAAATASGDHNNPPTCDCGAEEPRAKIRHCSAHARSRLSCTVICSGISKPKQGGCSITVPCTNPSQESR